MTGIIRKTIDDTTPPDAEVRRDGTIETDWFPIFRSGTYPQGKYSREDIDEVVEEFSLSGRRPPMVFDHLTAEDFKEDAKPGPAAGFLVALRAVDSTDSRFPGARVLEARAKASWYARYRTREGGYRNLSVGLYKCQGQDGKKRLAVHHLALLGAAPPQITGLPEVLFSERTGFASREEILSFSVDDCFPSSEERSTANPSSEERSMKETITFSEHEALLGKQKSDLELTHSKALQKFQEELDEAKGAAETAQAQAAEAKDALAALEASIPVKEEAAKQAGVTEGIEQGRLQAERLFAEANTKQTLKAFAEELRKSGKLTEQEFKGDDKKPPMADRLFAMPEATRQDFMDLLSARIAVAGPEVGEKPSNFRGEIPDAGVDSDEQLAADAQAMVAEGKAKNFREALAAVKSKKASKAGKEG